MPVPQSVSDALAKLQGDQDTLSGQKADSVAKEQALSDAQHAADVARNAVQSTSSQMSADLSAVITLLQQTYSDAPVAPPVVVPPVPPS